MQRVNKQLLCSILVLLVCLPIVFAGVWTPPPVLPPSFNFSSLCVEPFHVMCAEYGTNPLYDSVIGIHAYSNQLGARTFDFCAINKIDTGFGFVDGSFLGITNFTQMKQNDAILYDERIGFDYGSGIKYYDENCNGDEMFVLQNGRLTMTQYVENGVTFSVINTSSSIDDFDIIATNHTTGSLLNTGTYLQGTFLDEITNDTIENVNITILFKNLVGDTTPYLSFVTDPFGNFTTAVPRDISTYFDTYTSVVMIPKTQYIIIGKHPLYEDFVKEIDLVSPRFNETFYMKPFGVCESDCTFVGSNLCRKECQGINSCSFGSLPNGDILSVANAMHLQPKDTDQFFSVNGSFYTAQSCTGVVSEVPPGTGIGSGTSSCPEGESAWKTERLVIKDGEIVKLVVTICQ